ncbi:PIG-L deacetylase family protein [Nitriliruptor alkaliphilus]|uniref:PIG-L deacetylase family protein n=1 Tax=Nitriliruptor alkaliphilus TaxID=427918 RepID=UPI0006987C7C|nr:PIG-L family deacetylase [Nitriliruptor alkaliphilus]
MTTLDVRDLGTVLGVWAHPDDEAFLSAGLMARVTDGGGHVACVTATRGERGTSDPGAWPLERLGRRRAVELRASLAAVGVSDHRFLGYVDGTVADVDPQEGIERIGAILDQVQPDTVVTFGPDGMTGHDDHVAVSGWTTQAVAAAGRPIQLLYATTTAEFTHRWAAVNRDLEAFAPGLPLATPADRVALELHLDADELDRKLVALAAQSSQMVPLIARLGEEVLRRWWGTESFTEASTSNLGGRHRGVSDTRIGGFSSPVQEVLRT